MDAKARERGLLMNNVGERILRLAPALTVSDAELDRGCDLLAEALKTA